MVWKKKRRCCRNLNDQIVYKPAKIPMSKLETITIEIDEFEALRLCDLESKNQIEASDIMKVSRGTLQRILKSGRAKLVEALLNSKSILIKHIEAEDNNENTEIDN